MCGLKRKDAEEVEKQRKSHPVWVCGLKPAAQYAEVHHQRVTPCMGVWIETACQIGMAAER